MDRNSLIGFGLLALIMVYWFSTQEPPAEQEQKAQTEQTEDKTYPVQEAPVVDTAQLVVSDTADADSLAAIQAAAKAMVLAQEYGPFAAAAEGEDGYAIIENDKMILTVSKRGGRIVQAELKEYHTYDSLPLYLFDEAHSSFNLSFQATQLHLINSESLYYKPSSEKVDASAQDGILTMVAASASGNESVQFEYVLRPGSYLVDFNVRFTGIDDARKLDNRLDMAWSVDGLKKEKSEEPEVNASSVYFRYLEDGEVDEISERGFDVEKLEQNTHWVAFKQQYFSAALINPKGFSYLNSEVETVELNQPGLTQGFRAKLSSEIPKTGEALIPMQMYLGPNHYQTLKDLELGLENVIDLGWFGFINEWLVIPIFNWLDAKHVGYGLIILILTLVIKVILFPLTYKNFKSSAKMRVLKPQIDEINEKHKDSDAMKKQQATMALYKSVGVNPLAGCVPMLLQFPILVALFRFFPSSIELRQQPFLWADDLSSYDSIIDLPFEIPLYGDHVSLFTILMCISTFLYTRYNMQSQASTGPQAQQMKIMMYFMPVMLLIWFNSYASGLSYYYFLANLVSITQHLVIKKWFIDEDKLLASMKAYKAGKGSQPKKKSKFAQRLEEAQRQAQQRAKR